MKRRALLLMSLLLAGAAHAESRVDELAPDQWPHLLRAARAVPGFAGLAFVPVEGTRVLVPALTNPGREEQARRWLQADPFWKKVGAGKLGVMRGVQPVPYSGVQLVQAAQALKKRRPDLTVRVNTTLNRVTVYAPAGVLRSIARAAGVERFVESAYEYARAPRVRFDVQPRAVSLAAVRAAKDPSQAVPRLQVRVTNPTGAPLLFTFSCGGSLPVQVADRTGRVIPEHSGVGCTEELNSALILPGQTLTFPSFPLTKMSHLKPGQYRWLIGGQLLPFTLTP
ncbi:hypothetical protein F8S09_00625 [Deinococcus sp. SDU3-2]|uniref:Uncharacterized protein n=1 Tax=Deinococcus terrestris TaxID=2651870 RepID=A0A7X1TQD9_9DEIO|nr:hypothetical protein [Deinococcus terrestris]MPY65199.1 hypothetical protein [Deinococcus terrestris]